MKDVGLLDDTSKGIEGHKFLCGHLVGLTALYREAGSSQDQFTISSGFVFKVGDATLLVTAGHALKDLDRDDVEVKSCQLLDYFGPRVKDKHPIWFDFERATKVYVNRDGIDLGVIPLSDWFANQLAANDVTAFDPQACGDLDGLESDKYLLVGLPDEFLDVQILSQENGVEVAGTISPSVVFLERVREIPEEYQTKYPRFAGKLVVDSPLNLKGTSGGAIIRYRETNAVGQYWLVAIQSSQVKDLNLIFGCPVAFLMELLEACVEEYQRRRSDSQATRK